MEEKENAKTGEIFNTPVAPEKVETSALANITRGEVDMQVATAKRYPRSITQFKRDALTMVTQDEETAASCFYSLKRSQKVIEGPSVRMAEIVASCWGNLRCQTRIVEETDKHITAQGVCWDMEKNLLNSIEKWRRITYKDGGKYDDDMVMVTANAASSIAFRDAVFRTVPVVYVRALFTEAKKTACGDARTLPDRREKAFVWFEKIGVSRERVLAYLGKKGPDDVDLTDIETLTGTKTAISEGSSTIDDTFGVESPKDGAHAFGFKGKAREKAAKGQDKSADQLPASMDGPAAPAAQTTDLETVLAGIANAESETEMAAVKPYCALLTGNDRAKAMDVFKKKQKEIAGKREPGANGERHCGRAGGKRESECQQNQPPAATRIENVNRERECQP